jgi:FkbM family methyltransferase
MKFYSQCEEDKLLYEKYFKHYSLEGQKYYFEMGAIDGVMYSNTKFYEETLGWTGILVEANPFVFPNLVMNRPNNKLINAVCSDQKETLTFNVCANVPAVCSLQMTKPPKFDQEYYSWSKMVQVNSIPVTLDTIIGNSGVKRIDLCVVDVEGHEVNVLKSFSFEIPVVLWLIEFLDDEKKNNEVVKIMTKNNCKFMGKCAHNAVFINKDYLQYFNISN